MNDSSAAVIIDYYSDVLCVWAWIGQPRLEELQRQWGQSVNVRHRYVDIFGDTRVKIPGQWGRSDGYQNFHNHIVKSAIPFEHVAIHPDVWTRVQPHSSMVAHLVLKAVSLTAGEDKLAAMAKSVRQQFFSQGRDIGKMHVLLDIADELAVDLTDLTAALDDGRAMAALSDDLRSANDKGVKGSPTWVLDGGRQLLYGNVGYRILSANIEELVNQPSEDASWC